jgi:hypothetical protein
MKKEESTVYDHWIKELDAEKKAHKTWRNRAKKVMERYMDEEKSSDARFNILWSNTEVLHSALYNKAPNPDIRRRFKDKDPVAREVSDVMERAVSYTLDIYDFDSTVDKCVDDYLLAGMGNARLRYEPYFETGEKPVIPLEVKEIPAEIEDFPSEYEYYEGETLVDPTEVQQGDEGPFRYGEPEEELVYEEVTCEPIPWNRFRWQPAKRWEDVGWTCIDHFLSKDELEDQFGDKAKDVPLSYSEDGEKLSEEEDGKGRALVHEIFCKSSRKVIVIAPGCPDPLAEEDDPLDLEGFYPFPAPMVATTASDKFIPVPDFIYYQDQAAELDSITQRIDKLTEELKYRGIYDGSFQQLQNVANSDDGEFTAIDDFAQRFPNGRDLDEVIKVMPLEELQRVIVALYQAREQVKQTIYEITGIADIMRGSSKATETLGAQQLKTQFGSMRLTKRQRIVNTWVRNLIKLKAEIIVEHFDPQTLSLITGKEITHEMMQVMRDDLLRSYKIDIETDSTITEDAAQERQDRIDLLTSITSFADSIGPAVQEGIVPLEIAKELLLFGVRGFKSGRNVEDALESIGGDEEQQGENPEVMQLRQQLEQMQMEAQQVIQNMQGELAQSQAALEDKRTDAAMKERQTQMQLVEKQSESQAGRELDRYRAELDAQTKLQIEQMKIDAKERELALPTGGDFEQFKAEIGEFQGGVMQRYEEITSQLQAITQALQAMNQERESNKMMIIEHLNQTGTPQTKQLIERLN